MDFYNSLFVTTAGKWIKSLKLKLDYSVHEFYIIIKYVIFIYAIAILYTWVIMVSLKIFLNSVQNFNFYYKRANMIYNHYIWDSGQNQEILSKIFLYDKFLIFFILHGWSLLSKLSC